MSFLHGTILFGLFAIALPPLIHLLSRRRFDEVDWAAMCFLRISPRTRRRARFEQWALMLLRMLLIAAAVLAIAAPVVKLGFLDRLGGGQLALATSGSGRDIVLVVDGSYSMDCRWNNQTAHEAAQVWGKNLIAALGPGDHIAIVQAKQKPIPILGNLTADRQEAAARLEQMPRPSGGVDWLKAVEEAGRILANGRGREKQVVLLTDGQKQGWADSRALLDWQLLALGLGERSGTRLWAVNVAPERPAEIPNWALSNPQASRALATVGREVVFAFELRTGFAKRPNPQGTAPIRVKFLVDDEPAGEQSVTPGTEPLARVEFRRPFTSTGSHLVSAVIADDDALPGDNRRDFAVDVLPAIPVLLVVGESDSTTEGRASDFLRFAIAPSQHPQPSFYLRTISVGELGSQVLNNPVTRDFWTLPRVVILQNVAALTEVQHKTIEEFLKRGGGVWVLPGGQTDAEAFNKHGFRNGAGWLPALLGAPAGKSKGSEAAPLGDGLDRTFLDSIKQSGPDSFIKSTFARWWRLDTTSAGAGHVIVRLSTGDPLVVEKAAESGGGRVLMMAVPLDGVWKTSLLQSYDFVRLCHESLFHLAGARSAEVNLQPGQELAYRPLDAQPPGGVSIRLPGGQVARLDVNSWPVAFDDTRETGVYKLTTDSGAVQYYVVQPDGLESNLAACDDADRKAVRLLFPEGQFTYVADAAEILNARGPGRGDPELGWLMMFVVMALLVVELAATRALVKRNPPAPVAP